MRDERTMHRLMSSGLLLRGYRSALLTTGAWRDVIGQVPASCARLLRDPPAPEAWLPATWLCEMAEALGRTAGREACRGLGYAFGEEVAGGALKPLITTLIALHRSRLSGIYGRLPSIALLLLRGTHLSFQPTGEREGRLEIAHAEPMPEAVYALWEGSLLYAHHLCGVEGGVGRADVREGGLRGLVPIHWP